MAITGEGFCTAAWNGFLLNVKHAGAFANARFFAITLIFIGKAGVTMLNCMTFLGLMKAMDNKVGSTTGPLIVVGLITWMSCEIWLGIFDSSILPLIDFKKFLKRIEYLKSWMSTFCSAGFVLSEVSAIILSATRP